MSVLPARPKPLANENFLSWLTRLARANLCQPTEFTQITLEGWDVWGGCVNGNSNKKPELKLSSLTGIDKNDIRALYSGTFARRHFVELNQFYGAHYFLPANAIARYFTSNWIQFCPLCISEDKEPYYRNKWRISFLPVCIKHGCLLYDCCPRCNVPMNFHQVHYQSASMGECFNCGLQFANCYPYKWADRRLLLIIKLLNEGVESGWVGVNKNTVIMMPLFLAGIWLMLKPFFKKNSADILTKHFELPFNCKEKNVISFTHFSSLHRAKLLTCISVLLKNWPNDFVEVTSKLNLTRVTFCSYEKFIPYWFDSVVNTRVRCQPYWVTDIEFEAAAIYLRKNGFEISFSNIAEAAGLSRSCERTKSRIDIINRVKPTPNYSKKFYWFSDQ